ncbi:MAG: GatB/YqeY domain-containing protein [Candidatus Portnoybacteria bacterium]|nr:GatB/YqeY domain-containing protein [Candidatus Portnoybacteria bacterium]
MNLKEKISSDVKEAMKKKDELTLTTLRGVLSSIKNKEIDKKEELNEEEALEVLMSEAKKRKDSIQEFKKGNRPDLVEKEEKELEILKEYLPEQLSEEQIKEEAKKTIEEVNAVGPQDTGKVMGALMPKLKGKADGNLVSKTVQDLLKGN